MSNWEVVNHPAHYKKDGQRECIVAMEEDYGIDATIIFCLTSAYKYLYRAGNKPGSDYEDDVAKAKWYVDYAEKLSHKNGDAHLGLKLYLDLKSRLFKMAIDAKG